MFGRLLTFMIPVLFLILLPCYTGNELTVASEGLSASLFHQDWIQESEEFQTAVKIFMENLKNPVKISAFEVYELSLQTCLKIVNSAYSCFAVLTNLNK